MEFTSAKYAKTNNDETYILAVLDENTLSIPIDDQNRHYVALMQMVDAGQITIQDADPNPETIQIITKAQFCAALVSVGILTEADAEHAALGNWPESFAPALNNKTLVERLELKRLWQKVDFVPRNAPLFVDILAFYAGQQGLTFAQSNALADQIFTAAT